MAFRSIQNQPAIVSFLTAAIGKNRLPHALLFAGVENSGQKETARELAQALFCREKESEEACGACAACIQVGKDSHPDLLFIGPEGDSQTVKIEEIRRLIALAHLRPFSAPVKIFVIEKAERMNEAAQNALLKTLEEPPGRTHFVLLSSSPGALLPTVRSRMQTLHFMPSESAGVFDVRLEDLKKESLEFILGLLEKDPGSSTVDSPDFSKLDRAQIGEILDFLIGIFWMALRVRAGAETPDLSVTDAHRELASGFDESQLSEMMELLAETKERVAGTINVKLALAYLWENITSPHRFIT